MTSTTANSNERNPPPTFNAPTTQPDQDYLRYSARIHQPTRPTQPQPRKTPLQVGIRTK